MEDGREPCEKHKGDSIVPGFCNRCPIEKVKTLCPMDVYLMNWKLKRELGLTEEILCE